MNPVKEIRIQLLIAFLFSFYFGLGVISTGVLVKFITFLAVFLWILAGFSVVQYNSESWPGWSWLNEAMRQIKKPFYWLFIYTVVFYPGMALIKFFLSPGKEKRRAA